MVTPYHSDRKGLDVNYMGTRSIRNKTLKQAYPKCWPRKPAVYEGNSSLASWSSLSGLMTRLVQIGPPSHDEEERALRFRQKSPADDF